MPSIEILYLKTLLVIDMKKTERIKEKTAMIESLVALLSSKGIGTLTREDCWSAIDSYVESYAQTYNLTPEEAVILKDECIDIVKYMFNLSLRRGFIQKNVFKDAQKQRIETRFINAHMRKKTLTNEEEIRIFRYLAKDENSRYQDPRSFGAMLMLLTGLTAAEVCALKFEDLHNSSHLTSIMPKGNFEIPEDDKDYVFIITKLYNKIGSKLSINDITTSPTKCRIIPISTMCQQQIKNRCEYLHEKYHEIKDIGKLPLVCESRDVPKHITTHCNPDNLRKYIKNTVLPKVNIKPECLYIPAKNADGKGSRFILTLNLSLLRSNFEYRAKHICGMSDGEINYMLGRKCNDVDSKHYREFREVYNQQVLRQKLARWQIFETGFSGKDGIYVPADGLKSINESASWSGTVLPQTNLGYTTFALNIMTSNPGAPLEIDFSCLKGCDGTLVITELED